MVHLPDVEAQSKYQTLIKTVYVDFETNTLTIMGDNLQYKDKIPEVTLGEETLSLISYAPDVIKANLPATFVASPGGYRLTVTARKNKKTGYDAYSLTIGKVGQEGTQGIQGEPGPQGPQGEQGIQGETGLQGTQGIQGQTGLPGPQGIQGATGPKGGTGDTGPKGLQGLQGAQGLKGDTGAVGAQGLKGDKGDPGNTGPQGLAGADGATGPQGLQGAQGLKGDTGSKGDTGVAGPAGATGPQGPQGGVGPAGAGSGTYLSYLVGKVTAQEWVDNEFGRMKTTVNIYSVSLADADPVVLTGEVMFEDNQTVLTLTLTKIRTTREPVAQAFAMEIVAEAGAWSYTCSVSPDAPSWFSSSDPTYHKNLTIKAKLLTDSIVSLQINDDDGVPFDLTSIEVTQAIGIIETVSPDPVEMTPGGTADLTVNISNFTGMTTTYIVMVEAPSLDVVAARNIRLVAGESASPVFELKAPADLAPGTYSGRVLLSSPTGRDYDERSFTIEVAAP